MSRKPSWIYTNVPEMKKFLDANGYEYHEFSPYHYRVIGAVAIVDIYPSRMVYNIINIDGVEQRANFQTNMKQSIDIKELKQLLEKGRVL